MLSDHKAKSHERNAPIRYLDAVTKADTGAAMSKALG